MKYKICTIIMVCLLSSSSFSQLYWWDLKQPGSSLGGPIDVANFIKKIEDLTSKKVIY